MKSLKNNQLSSFILNPLPSRDGLCENKSTYKSYQWKIVGKNKKGGVEENKKSVAK